MKHTNIVAGIIFILAGVILLFANITSMSLGKIWPFFVLAPAIYLSTIYFTNRSLYGLLMPISILVISSGIFIYCSFYGWHQMNVLWPLFIAAPGIGFLLMHIFGQRETVFLVLGIIFIGIGSLLTFTLTEHDKYWPILLILLGLYLILRKRK